MKKSLTATTLILFAIGIGSALYVLYDYIESADRPKLIGKEEALAIATRVGNWSQNFLSDKTIDMKLLHTKTSGFAFIVDDKTLEDVTPFCPQNSPCIEPYETNGHGIQDGQYVWTVTVTGQPPNILSGRQWGYMIDAKNGQVLNPIQNMAVLEPTDPQISVKEGTLISQARGNVTIVFPADISKEEPRQSPFPAQLIITEGDTVTWRNDDNVPHTVTSGFPQQEEFIGQIFDSGIIASGQSFSHTFSDKKITSYHYFCTIHPWMTGEVMVQD